MTSSATYSGSLFLTRGSHSRLNNVSGQRSRRSVGRPRKSITKCTAAGRFDSIPKGLEALVERKNLTKDQTKYLLDDLLADPNPSQISAFLVLLRSKGETADEVAGLAQSMLEKAIHVDVPFDVVDIVGTGGDGIGSVNISTGASVIAAAAGAKVAKHGNRSVSSKCGSADVLEALGVALDLGPREVETCIKETGIGFMLAPIFSPQMKAVKDVRVSLKLFTVFNILGPLLNPAKAKYGLIGVGDPSLMKLMADAFAQLSVKKALVLHSLGLDELTPMGLADVLEVTPKGTKAYTVDPKEFGIPRCEVKDLLGGEKELNAKILMDVFGGESGPVANTLNLNAGFALAACGVADNPKDGIALAQEAQKSGKASEVMKQWSKLSQELSKSQILTEV